MFLFTDGRKSGGAGNTAEERGTRESAYRKMGGEVARDSEDPAGTESVGTAKSRGRSCAGLGYASPRRHRRQSAQYWCYFVPSKGKYW